jgi:hypothetical protein
MIDYIAKIIVAILILILIIVLLNFFPKFILVIIIALFFVLFVINLEQLINYTNRYAISKKEGESLKTYCSLDKYKIFDYNILFDTTNLILFIIYLILFILFWTNKIASDINNSLNTEIKILGFYKYYNKDIYKNYNYEYECIYAIMLFIAISTAVYGLNLIYYNLLGLNKKENDVIDSIEKITNLLKENINQTYLEYYISEINKPTSTSTFKNHQDFFERYIVHISQNDTNKKREALALYNANPNEFYLKSHITFKLFEFESREKKDVNLPKLFESSNYCIFDILSGKDIEDMFPSTINYVNPIRDAIKPNKTLDYNKIEDSYKIFIDKLKNNYSIIKAYEKVNIFYYKLDLLFTKFSGVFFSLFAIVFFIKTEFKQIFKTFFNINIDPLEYTIDKYNKIFKFILLIMVLLFISILFNS